MKGIAYDAEETDMEKVVILVFGNTLSFIGYMIATKRSIETTMTIQIEAVARFSKVPKTFRVRKAIRKTPTRLFGKAGLST